MFYDEECAIPIIKQTTIGSHGSHQITRQNRITRDKSGTKRDLKEPNGNPGYGVTVHMQKQTEISNFYQANKYATMFVQYKYIIEYQLSGAGVTRSPPATPYDLLNRKWLTGGPKMADRA